MFCFSIVPVKICKKLKFQIFKVVLAFRTKSSTKVKSYFQI